MERESFPAPMISPDHPTRPNRGERTTESVDTSIETAVSYRLWMNLIQTTHLFQKKVEEHIRQFGLTLPQYGALESLGRHGAMTIGDLSKKQLTTGGNMTVVVDNLEKLGLVERAQRSEDRRTIMVHLTEAGEKTFNDIDAQHSAAVAVLASVLPADDQRLLSGLLRRLGYGIRSLAPKS